MNKRVLLACMAGFAIITFGWFKIGHAQEFRQGNSATIGANEIVDSSAYLAGQHVDVAGQVQGDLFCAGQNITISGTIHGDVICAGQTITITGTVDGDVRVAAQTVVISSNIGNNLTVGAQDLTLDSNAKVGGDITGGVDSMVINGSVGRDLVLGATDATINGSIGRNIKSDVNRLHLGSGSKVGGSINYTSNYQLDRAQNSVVAGGIHRSEPKKQESRNGWFGIGFRAYWFLAMLVVALTLVLLFPSIFQAASDRTAESPGKTLLIGILATMFTPIIFVLLMVTIIGIPLGLILMLGWIMALILSGPFFAYLIGRLLWKNQENHILMMLLGAVILLLIYNIPWIGSIAMVAAVFIGMGMLVREIIEHTPKPVYKTK